MNKLTTAVLGFTLMVGSAFAAAPQATDNTTAAPAAATAPAKTKAAKVKKTKKNKTPVAAAATDPAATPTK